MAKRTFQVFISPVHAVQISCDSLEVIQNVLQFKKGGELCGQFSQYLGWIEVLDKEERAEKGTLLNLVPKSDPPTVAPPEGAA